MKSLSRFKAGSVKMYLAVGGAFSVLAAYAVGSSFAAEDPVLTAASNQVTTYFTDNLPVAIGAFIVVCGVLWILSLIFKSVGIHRRRSVG